MTWDDSQDITANRHGNDPFSVAAHDSIKIPKGRIRQTILTYIYMCEQNGATCDEVERRLGLNHQSCSARIAELRAMGKLHTVDNERRRTSNGRWARVHRVPDSTVEEDQPSDHAPSDGRGCRCASCLQNNLDHNLDRLNVS